MRFMTPHYYEKDGKDRKKFDELRYATPLEDKTELLNRMRSYPFKFMMPAVFRDPYTRDPISMPRGETGLRGDDEFVFSNEFEYLFEKYDFVLPDDLLSFLRKE